MGIELNAASAIHDRELRQTHFPGAAYSGAVSLDSDLRAIIDAWPGLSPAMQGAILAMVNAVNGSGVIPVGQRC